MNDRLFLIVSKKWFDMIASGEKKEEYRRCCPHWDRLIFDETPTEVLFQLGYNKTRRMKFKINNVYRYPNKHFDLTYATRRKEEWGFNPEISQYIIMLGRRLDV